MFDSPYDFFALLIAIVALIFARKAINQAAMLRARLDAMEAAWEARLARPPLTPLRELEQTPATPSPGIAAEAPAPSVDEHRAALYEWADALEATGETTRALVVLLDLVAEQGDYKDARARIDRLSRVQA